jgi:hypothetical protein
VTLRGSHGWNATFGSCVIGLDGKLRELRFYLEGRPTRITYWIAPGRRIILLTVFVKTQRQERREIGRARQAMERCANEAPTTSDEE